MVRKKIVLKRYAGKWYNMKKNNKFKIIESKVKFAKTFKDSVSDLNFALRKGFPDEHIINASEDVCVFFRAVKKELNKNKLRKVM